MSEPQRVSDERIRVALAVFAFRRQMSAQSSGGIPVFFPEEQLWLDLYAARQELAKCRERAETAEASVAMLSGELRAWLESDHPASERGLKLLADTAAASQAFMERIRSEERERWAAIADVVIVRR